MFAEPASLALTDAIQLALDHNRSILTARLNAQASAFDITGQEAAFDLRLLPQASLGAGDASDTSGYGLTVARKISWGTELSAGVNLSQTSPDNADPLNTGRLIVRVDQPLFRDAGPLVQLESIRLAESRHQQSLRLLESTKADVVLAVVERFEDILRLERLLDADEQRTQRLGRLQRLTALREKQGRATRLDTLRVELQLGQSHSSRESHQEQLDAARRAFADLLGMPPDQRYTLVLPPQLDLALPAPELAAATALSNRLDYAQALQDLSDASRGQRIAKRRLWPELRLTSRVEQTGTGPESGDALAFSDTTWFIGFSGDTDLLRRRDRASYQSAAIETATVRLTGEIVRDRIVREVQDELGAYRRAAQESILAAQNLDLARRRLQLAARLFRMGRTDNESVTDAEVAFLAAQTDQTAALADASVAGYRVLRAMGTLIEVPPELKATAL